MTELETPRAEGPDEGPTEVYGGAHRRVLDHPEHTVGIDHGILTVTRLEQLSPTVVRLTGRVEHAGPRVDWTVPNPALRFEVPDLDNDRMVSRVYTVRACRISPADELEIDVDVVRHDGRSPMMQWLAGAAIGTRVRVLGPRAHFRPAITPGVPVGLFADDTAVPALATILRAWPEGQPGEAFLESPDETVVADLPTPEGVAITWLRRSPGEQPGTTGRLVDAALDFSSRHPGPVTVWACGEHGEMRRVRDHFRHDRGMTRPGAEVFGYWRRHVSSSEIDMVRLRRYEELLDRGEQMTVLDDFDVDD